MALTQALVSARPDENLGVSGDLGIQGGVAFSRQQDIGLTGAGESGGDESRENEKVHHGRAGAMEE